MQIFRKTWFENIFRTTQTSFAAEALALTTRH